MRHAPRARCAPHANASRSFRASVSLAEANCKACEGVCQCVSAPDSLPHSAASLADIPHKSFSWPGSALQEFENDKRKRHWNIDFGAGSFQVGPSDNKAAPLMKILWIWSK